MSNEKLIMLIYKMLPYSNQVTDLDLQESDAIRFEWRGDYFRVSSGLMVEQIEHSCLVGSNMAIILQALLKEGRNKA